MRITSVHLKNYKRFTDLHISEIPQSARLVVMVGPNGSGKSSVFDAFLLKSHSQINNWSLTDARFGGYLVKDEELNGTFRNTQQVANNVTIKMNEGAPNWTKAFSIRSPYRHEADFANTNLGPVKPAHESPRFQRIIDQDQAVSDNFNRLGRGHSAHRWRDPIGSDSALYSALKGEPDEKSLGQCVQ